jgi:hypothetical protein
VVQMYASKTFTELLVPLAFFNSDVERCTGVINTPASYLGGLASNLSPETGYTD